MHIFVTGATGFIGFAIVKELIEAGHEVTGLARSESSAQKLLKVGARAQIGTVEDLECLRRAASAADGAVHTAFYHKLTHMPLSTRLQVFLGGSPSNIVQRFMAAAVNTNSRAVQTIGNALPGNGSPFAVAFGTLSMTPGRLAIEDDRYDPTFIGAPRAQTEDVLKKLVSRGVRTSAIRLSPIVHDADDHGFLPQLIKIARDKKQSAYVDDGKNRWPSVHRLDAARLFRLALEQGADGGTYHGVAEEGIPFRQIAELIGKRINVPTVSKSDRESQKHFGFLGPFVSIDNPASSSLTQQRLGWKPTHVDLLTEMQTGDYFSR